MSPAARGTRIGAAALAFAATMLSPDSEAAAQCTAERPTDPSPSTGLTYGAAPVAFVDRTDVRVWYATLGPHTPNAPTDPDDAADVLQQALAGFAAMGYLPPPGDGGYDPCASNGGDGRLDAYIMSFGGSADGTAVTEQCTGGITVTCSGFMILDVSLSGYGSYTIGTQVVGAHELFHLVQYAYDADMDRWWLEGTAQWATDQLYPELTDMESFFPVFFADIERPLNSPPGGIVAGWLYGSAIWPTFLGEHLGPQVVLDIMDRQATRGGDVIDTTSDVLVDAGTDLPSTHGLFVAWNAATGDRASDPGGYADAAKYPMVTLSTGPDAIGESLNGLLAGLMPRYYVSHGVARPLSIDVDPARARAYAVPLVEGRARLEALAELPTDVDGDTVVVVVGTTTSKIDVPYRLEINEASFVDEPPVDEPPAPDTDSGSSTESGGCAIHPGHDDPSTVWRLACAALIGLRLRRRGYLLGWGVTRR